MKNSVFTMPYQEIFFPKTVTVLGSSVSNKIPTYTGKRGKIHGEKKDKIPAKNTEIENNKDIIGGNNTYGIMVKL